MTHLSIGDLAKRTDTKVGTIRYYEQAGLLATPIRSAGNYRCYDQAALGRLSFIRRARDLGFSLDQIRELLALADQKDRSCEQVDRIAVQHFQEIERKIADLTALRDELAEMINCCSRGTIAACRIIEALAPAGHAPDRLPPP